MIQCDQITFCRMELNFIKELFYTIIIDNFITKYYRFCLQYNF